LKVAISALLKTVPDMLPVLFVTIIFYIILSITGHYLLFMKMRDCVVDRSNEEESLYSDELLHVKTTWDCNNVGGMMINTHSHFDYFFASLFSVFHSSTTAGWAEVMYRSIDNDG